MTERTTAADTRLAERLAAVEAEDATRKVLRTTLADGLRFAGEPNRGEASITSNLRSARAQTMRLRERLGYHVRL